MEEKEPQQDDSPNQRSLDAEDTALRMQRLEDLYDEDTEIRKEISEAKRTIRLAKSKLTQNQWFIREQLRVLLGKDRDPTIGPDGEEQQADKAREVPDKGPLVFSGEKRK